MFHRLRIDRQLWLQDTRINLAVNSQNGLYPTCSYPHVKISDHWRGGAGMAV